MTSPQPIAVPTQPLPAVPSNEVGKNAPPPVTNATDTDLSAFHKLAAERRERTHDQPLVVPFGTGQVRIHATMPSTFAFDAQAAEVDPYAAKRLIRDSIIAEDQHIFDEVLLLPPDNPQGVDGLYLLGFMEALAVMYTGVPLGAASR